MFKVQNIFVLKHRKVNDHKSMCTIFHSIAKLIVNYSDIN